MRSNNESGFRLDRQFLSACKSKAEKERVSKRLVCSWRATGSFYESLAVVNRMPSLVNL